MVLVLVLLLQVHVLVLDHFLPRIFAVVDLSSQLVPLVSTQPVLAHADLTLFLQVQKSLQVKLHFAQQPTL